MRYFRPRRCISQQLTDSLHSHLTAMSLLSFAVGLFIVFNAVRFSLWYRRATLLDLRLMGCASHQLFSAILLASHSAQSARPVTATGSQAASASSTGWAGTGSNSGDSS